MPGGRPPKFTDPVELDKLIDDYIDNCPDIRRVVSREGEVVELPCYTLTGLALHLGFCDKCSLYDYQKKPEFSHSIKRARAFIERHYEMLLQAGNGAGAIFALKNFGWRDKQEVEHTGSGVPQMTVILHGNNENKQKIDTEPSNLLEGVGDEV